MTEEKPKCFGDWGEECLCKDYSECLIKTFNSRKVKYELLRKNGR
jgi:hypothetical protein